jgi:hypothetical protein
VNQVAKTDLNINNQRQADGNISVSPSSQIIKNSTILTYIPSALPLISFMVAPSCDLVTKIDFKIVKIVGFIIPNNIYIMYFAKKN